MTWTVKLFPMYSGGRAGVARWGEVWNWYAGGATAAHTGDLTLLAPAPAEVLYGLLAISMVMTLGLAARAVRDLVQNRQRPMQ